MIQTKYNLNFPTRVLDNTLNRLTNQIWKLIPMRENNENREDQLDKILIELLGLNEILINNDSFFTLLMNLEGLKLKEVEFNIYRSKVFESINLLREAFKDVKDR